MERRGQRPTGRPGREPADQEPGIERVARAGRVSSGEVLRSRPRTGAARRPRSRGRSRPSGPRLTTATGANSSRPSTAWRPSSASASDAVANSRSGAISAISDRAARRPWASSGPIEARSTLTIAPAARARLDRLDGRPGPAARRAANRPAGGARRRPRNHAGSQVVGVAAGRPLRDPRRSSARRRAPRAPRSARSARPRPGSTRSVTLSARTASTSARPAASRPTAAIRVDRAPSRPSQRAVFAADPPWTSATRPGTSVPASSGRAGAGPHRASGRPARRSARVRRPSRGPGDAADRDGAVWTVGGGAWLDGSRAVEAEAATYNDGPSRATLPTRNQVPTGAAP